jgi:hypothetical protein
MASRGRLHEGCDRAMSIGENCMNPKLWLADLHLEISITCQCLVKCLGYHWECWVCVCVSVLPWRTQSKSVTKHRGAEWLETLSSVLRVNIERIDLMYMISRRRHNWFDHLFYRLRFLNLYNTIILFLLYLIICYVYRINHISCQCITWKVRLLSNIPSQSHLSQIYIILQIL